jgi:hypothetical protein
MALALATDVRPSIAAEPPPSLATALTREIGGEGSVAILGSYEGLIALSTDGKRCRTLVPGRIFGVRVVAPHLVVAQLVVAQLRRQSNRLAHKDRRSLTFSEPKTFRFVRSRFSLEKQTH